MYGSEIDHVMMHLCRMEREVKDVMFTDGNSERDDTRLTFLVALKQAQDAVREFRVTTSELSTANLT